MATKTKKAATKKSTAKIRDLNTRKDPKGGAQKKESNGLTSRKTGGGSTLGAGRRQPV